jgi:CheY-like chemotaxis protein
VLVAEDNAVNRRLAVEILRRAGHIVESVENGREAVEAVAAQPFDVVVMDVQMPDMNGLEAARAIRNGEMGTGRRQPILALTAHANGSDIEECRQAGMDDYLSKPVHHLDLVERVARLGTGARSGEAKPADPGTHVSVQ